MILLKKKRIIDSGIELIRHIYGRGFQRGQRPFWHTTLFTRSSVLYLPADDIIPKREVAHCEGGFLFWYFRHEELP